MGQTEKIRLENRTSRRWTKVHEHNHQMTSWDFPNTIEPGAVEFGRVEWSEVAGSTGRGDGGEVRYQTNSGAQFEVRARNDDGFTISARNISMPFDEWGSAGDVQLRSRQDGTMSLILPDASVESWMSRLPDDALLSALNMPGSHDSGTYKIDDGFARTQDLDFTSQLQMGVRFLDVRCRHIGNTFTIHHSSFYAHLNFDDVLEMSGRFLDANPSETLVMSVRDEYDPQDCTRSYEATFDEYATRYPLWYLEPTLPRLGDVRGRIVLVRRFNSGSPKGIPWEALQIQNNFQPDGIEEKWVAVREHLGAAVAGDASDWYVNFANAIRRDTWPEAFARAINPRLGDDLALRTGRYGTVVQDFCTEDVVRRVIMSNAARF